MQETQVPSLGWEDLLEKEMTTHSNILAWRIPWTEEPDGLKQQDDFMRKGGRDSGGLEREKCIKYFRLGTGKETRKKKKMPGSIKNPLTLGKVNIKRNQPLIHIQLQGYRPIVGREKALLRFVIYPSKYEKNYQLLTNLA